MRRIHKSHALRRRYGRSMFYDDYVSDLDRREADLLLKAQEAPTRRAPTLTIKEQIAWDKRLKAIRDAENER